MLTKRDMQDWNIEQMRDSNFYSSVLDEPARARFVILRNNQ